MAFIPQCECGTQTNSHHSSWLFFQRKQSEDIYQSYNVFQRNVCSNICISNKCYYVWQFMSEIICSWRFSYDNFVMNYTIYQQSVSVLVGNSGGDINYYCESMKGVAIPRERLEEGTNSEYVCARMLRTSIRPRCL